MTKKKKYLLQIPCNNIIIKGPLFLATETWEHIQDNHPEVEFAHLYETLGCPQYIYQDPKKQNGALIVASCVKEGSTHPLRVSVKKNLEDGSFVQTAFYSSDEIASQLLWSNELYEKEGGDDDK